MAEVLGLIVAVLAIVVTILAIWVGYILSRRYGDHIAELTTMREEHGKVRQLLEEAIDVNSTTLVQFKLTQKVAFNLVMSQNRRERVLTFKEDLESTGKWGKTVVNAARKAALLNNMKDELAGIEAEMQARQHELYWLVEEEAERSAYLHALVETHGDHETIGLFKRLALLNVGPEILQDLTAARVALERRLGLPFVVRSFSSGTWTGRPSP